MPAKDLFHNTVKTALEKDGWTITDEHLFLQVEDVDFYGEKIGLPVDNFSPPRNLTSEVEYF
jgi:hypothetical protein